MARLVVFLAIATVGLDCIFAMAELRENPFVSCREIETELLQAVEQGIMSEHEAQEVLDRCHSNF